MKKTCSNCKHNDNDDCVAFGGLTCSIDKRELWKKKDNTNTAYQILHKEDNGEIVACFDQDRIQLCCKHCKSFFKLPEQYKIELSDDFILYKK